MDEGGLRACSVHVRVRAVQHNDLKHNSPLLGHWGNFNVDGVHEGSQEQLFTDAVQPLVDECFLEGLSSLVMTYGAAQSGKTYALEGPTACRSGSEDGIIPRAVGLACSRLQVIPRHRYKLLVTYCGLSAGPESGLFDLLAGGASVASMKDAAGSTAWSKLTKHQLQSASEVYQLLSTARQAATKVAKPLHTCFTLQLVGQVLIKEQLQTIQTSMSFVELVAPDSRDQMGRPAAPDPLISRCVSLGYSSLTAVVAMLKAAGKADAGSRTSARVPWRDSPLTRWLQQPLSKAKELVVLATVSPSPQAAPDTLATLSYVSKLRSSGRQGGVQITASWEQGSPATTLARTATAATEYKKTASSRSHARGPAQAGSLPVGEGVRTATPLSPNVSRRSASVEHEDMEASTETTPFSFGGKQGSPIRQPSNIRSLDTDAISASFQASPVSPRVTQHLDATSSPASSCRVSRAVSRSASAPRGVRITTTTTPQGYSRRQTVEKQKSSRSRSGGGALVIQPAVSPSKVEQQGYLSAYLDVLRVIKQGCATNQAQAEAQLEYLYSAISDRQPQAVREIDQGFDTCAAASPASFERIISLQQRLDEAHRKLAMYESDRQPFTHEIQRLGEASLLHAKELEWQAHESSLQRQAAMLRDELATRQAALDNTTCQLADCRRQIVELQGARDRAEQQLQGAVDTMQSQVHTLREEVNMLRRRATEAAADYEAEIVARRALEAQLSQAQAAADSRQNQLVMCQQQVLAVTAQLDESNRLLETARTERNKLQQSAWSSEESSQRLAAQLEEAITERQAAEMEKRALMERTQADARANASTTAALQTSLASATTQVQALKTQLAQLQTAFEEQKRMESNAARDIKECESMLREFDRDLEVHTPPLWLACRADRGDTLLLAPDRNALTPATRWRPMLRALMAALKKQGSEVHQLQETNEKLAHQASLAQSKAGQVQELSVHLHAQQAAQVEALNLISELKAQLHESETSVQVAQAELERLGNVQDELIRKEETVATLQAECKVMAAEASKAQSLQHKVQTRDHMFSIIWGEVQNMHASLTALRAMSGRPAASPVRDSTPERRSLLAQLQEPLLGEQDDDNERLFDWSDPAIQQRAITTASQTRVKVSSMMAELMQCQQQLDEAAAATTQAQLDKERSITERLELKRMLDESKAQTAELRAQVQALQVASVELQGHLKGTESQLATCKQQIADLERDLMASQLSHAATQSRLTETETGLQSVEQTNNELKEKAAELQQQVEDLKSEVKASAVTAAADSAARQQAELEVCNQAARVQQLAGQVADLEQQLAVTSARLSATEKALHEANTKASELNSKLALTETDARIKAAELQERAAGAEAEQQLVSTRYQEESGHLAAQLAVYKAEVDELKQAVLDAQADRQAAQETMDAAESKLLEAQLVAQDTTFVRGQLQAMMTERDVLQDEIRQLKGNHLTATQECVILRSELDSVKAELQRTGADRLQLAAQLEAAKLDSVVSNALARSKAANALRTPGSMPAVHGSPVGTPVLAPSKTPGGIGALLGGFGLSTPMTDLKDLTPPPMTKQATPLGIKTTTSALVTPQGWKVPAVHSNTSMMPGLTGVHGSANRIVRASIEQLSPRK